MGFVDVLFAAEQLRRPGHAAQPHGAVRQQRRRHGQRDRRLPRRHQGPSHQAGGRQKAADKLVAERLAQKNEIVAIEAQLESLTQGIKDDIKRLEEQQAAAARAAAAAAAAQVTDTDTGTPPSGNIDPGGPGHPEVVGIAQRYLGVPYVWGGASPSGFDCSGLVMYCYAQIGIGLSHGATDQQRASKPVSLDNLAPGDLVFFGGPSYSHHVGIYVGGGSMINAPHTGAVVSYGSISGAWIGGRF